MSSKMTRIYVGCSLTKASEKFKYEVEMFKGLLRESGCEVFDFIGLENGSAEDVYIWDVQHCVKDCDILIAICDEPSIGLGWELAEAVRLGKRVLAVAHLDSKVTRLLLGAAEVEPNIEFRRYENLKDVISYIK